MRAPLWLSLSLVLLVMLPGCSRDAIDPRLVGAAPQEAP